MTWQAWATLATIGLTAAALIRGLAGPDTILLCALALLVAMGVVTPADAVVGFGNAGLITVAALFVVAGGLHQTGAMNLIVSPLLGRPRSTRGAQARLMLPVTVMSAFLNNTPIVAMFIPVVSDWSRKIGVSASKLFIPLSYAAILGGTCTLIGTSTNLVVNGLLLAEPGAGETASVAGATNSLAIHGLGMFDLAWIGVPCAIAGLAYCLIAGKWLLPNRRAAVSLTDDPRQYTVEMIVQPHSPLIGQTIEQAGLRHLPGLFLAQIDRDGKAISAVSPDERLGARDRLVFVGIIESVVDLRKMRGLAPATNQVFNLAAPPSRRVLIEAVVSDICPLAGQTIREGRFRSMYDAVVIAVGRGGQRINRKIGDIVLQAGDTLLLEADRSFVERQRNRRDFYLVSPVEDSTPPRHERAWVALAILAAMVAAVTAGLISMLGGALIAAAAMVVTRCCTGSQARNSLDWPVLLVIGAAFGIERAMTGSGAASGVATALLHLAGGHAWTALVMVCIVTMLFGGLITHNAAAVLVYPIAKAAAASLGVSFMPFAIALMLCASFSFASPISYQTNLMVYGPGGYRFSDYLKFGIPLNLIVLTITVLLTPQFWPF